MVQVGRRDGGKLGAIQEDGGPVMKSQTVQLLMSTRRFFANPRKWVRRLWKSARVGKQSNPEDWDFWIDANLKGPRELRESLALDEGEFRASSRLFAGDARAHFIYGVLDEIQKAALSTRSVVELLGEPGSRDSLDLSEQLVRTIVVWSFEDQAHRRRRLIEALVNLVCFGQTNTVEHYRHYLLLEELDGVLSLDSDLREFYACESGRMSHMITSRVRRIVEIQESGLPLGECWYLHSRRRLDPANLPNPGRLMSSTRSRMKKALALGNDRERTILGHSYRHYSEVSKAIHFNFSDPVDAKGLVAAVEKGVSIVGATGVACLLAAQDLLGIIPDGMNRALREASDSEELQLQLADIVHDRAQVGHFVAAYGRYLAEVLEVRRSAYGYESYRVQFLDGSPISGQNSDWLPPQEVTRIPASDASALESQLRARLSDEADGTDDPRKLSEEGLAALVRLAVIRKWRRRTGSSSESPGDGVGQPR